MLHTKAPVDTILVSILGTGRLGKGVWLRGDEGAAAPKYGAAVIVGPDPTVHS
ncbi:MAG: hypothetical protein R2704_15585 [Microthrixaceae bacterium]